MISDIKKLHELQFKYLGIIDMNIETRKDMKATSVSYCSYPGDFPKGAKLYFHKLKWFENTENEIHQIELELEMLSKKY